MLVSVPFWQAFSGMGIRLCFLVEGRADDFGSQDVPVVRFESFSAIDLQMSGQSEHEEFVDCRD